MCTYSYTSIKTKHQHPLPDVLFHICFRRRINKIQLIKGPNRILLTLEDVTFINPHFGSKVSSSLSGCIVSCHRQKLQVSIECMPFITFNYDLL